MDDDFKFYVQALCDNVRVSEYVHVKTRVIRYSIIAWIKAVKL